MKRLAAAISALSQLAMAAPAAADDAATMFALVQENLLLGMYGHAGQIGADRDAELTMPVALSTMLLVHCDAILNVALHLRDRSPFVDEGLPVT